MYEAIGIKDVNQILPPPAQVQPIDPSVEHINALNAKPFQAFPWSRSQSTHHSAFEFHVNEHG